MLGIAALPALVRFAAFFFLPESPRWLVGAGKVTKAHVVLQRLRKGRTQEDVDQELQEIRDDLENSRVHANKEGKQDWCGQLSEQVSQEVPFLKCKPSAHYNNM